MTTYPHYYTAKASAEPQGSVTLEAENVPPIRSAPPAQFGGSGDEWSPEVLLIAAVADCMILSFRAIARASKLDWRDLACEAQGVLDRADGVTRFTAVVLTATLRVPSGTDQTKAQRLLEKAKETCFVTNSLTAECRLEAHIQSE
ncbi:MAG: OsmC family protein [Acidiferrobacterales bacterium]